jgi:hypothetical protein
MKRIVSSIALVAALGACQATGTETASSATSSGPSTAAAAPYKAPRGPDGVHPDLNGVWQVLNTANYNIEAHPASAALQLRPGPYVPVPAAEVVALGAIGAVPAGIGIVQGDGKIPYTADALKLRDENRAKAVENDPEVKCYLPGIPRANYMSHPFQIVQSAASMMFVYEYAGAVRNVLFKDPGPPPADSWMGQSVGKWDGDTLVITVTGQNDSTWLDRSGNFHSPDMVVVERWTPTGPETMRYEATITDPQTFTRPWKISMNMYKLRGEDGQLNQFKCIEFVEELLYGPLRKTPLQ